MKTLPRHILARPIQWAALLLEGMLASEVRGSIGGTTFARNRHGAYARNRTVPINPTTVLQTEVRNRFNSMVTAWSDLTQGQRDAWDTYAAGLTLQNRLGQDYTPTGRQMFLQLNNQLAAVSSPILDVPPTGSSRPVVPETIALSVATDTGVLQTWQIAGLEENATIIVAIDAVPLGPGVKVNNSTVWRRLAAPTEDEPLDETLPFVASYGNVANEGDIAYARVKFIDTVTGQASPYQILSAIVQAV